MNNAIGIWNETLPYFVTAEQASTGTSPIRNVTFDSQCNESECIVFPVLVQLALLMHPSASINYWGRVLGMLTFHVICQRANVEALGGTKLAGTPENTLVNGETIG